MRRTGREFIGRWRIVHMDLWDKDYRDLVMPAYLLVERGGTGEFQFGTVAGGIDHRTEDRDGRKVLEFSWEGQNDNDPGCGRGWAALDGARLIGHLYIHLGDDSGFVARRTKSRAPA